MDDEAGRGAESDRRLGLLDATATGRLQRDLALALALRDDDGTAGALLAPSAAGAPAEPVAAARPCVAAVGPATIDLPGASLHVDAIISDGVGARLEGRLVIAGREGVRRPPPGWTPSSSPTTPGRPMS